MRVTLSLTVIVHCETSGVSAARSPHPAPVFRTLTVVARARVFCVAAAAGAGGTLVLGRDAVRVRPLFLYNSRKKVINRLVHRGTRRHARRSSRSPPTGRDRTFDCGWGSSTSYTYA